MTTSDLPLDDCQPDRYQWLGKGLPLADWFDGWILGPTREAATVLLREANCKRVLDACCGTGILAAELAATGVDVVAIDSSPTMLERARARGGFEVQLMDACELPFDSAFDGATISLALHEMPPAKRDRVWQATKRAVRRNGVLVATDFSPADRPTLLSRPFAAWIDWIEACFGLRDPVHRQNYVEFRECGGLPAWLECHGERVCGRSTHLGGNVAVMAVSV